MFSPEVMDVFWKAVSITGKGMLGIFLFMFLFFLIIQGIDKLFPKEIEKDDKK